MTPGTRVTEREEGVGILVAGCNVDTAGCLVPIWSRGIRVGFNDVDEGDVRNLRRIEMEAKACGWLLVTR